MKKLPNGLTIFNATPHKITFWRDDWVEPIEVEPDTKVDACPNEVVAGERAGVTLVGTEFAGTDKGRETIRQAVADGADLVVGSIIAAQAYPGEVVAMTPAPGYERVGFVDPILEEVLSALEFLGADTASSFGGLMKKLRDKIAQPSKRMNPDKFTVY